MDRLPALRFGPRIGARIGLGIVTLLAAACDSAGEVPAPGSRRVVSVRAGARRADALAGFCDVRGGDRRLKLPRLDQGRSWSSGSARWVNVWATWCKPCLAEMPMLLEWRSRLVRAGRTFELVFVSADESAQIVADLRRKNPRLPASSRLAHPDLLAPWITALGLDRGAGLPIHIFADPGGRIRCVRAAAVGENSYPLVEQLLR